MSNITDKELLTFCNLANLEMEYANIIKEIQKETIQKKDGTTETKETIINHTIYTIFAKQKSTLFQVCPFYMLKNVSIVSSSGFSPMYEPITKTTIAANITGTIWCIPKNFIFIAET